MNISILLAEDNDVVRKSMANFLLQAGYFITEARSGREALHSFREIQPHLIVSDLSMPEMGGLELLQILRRESEATPFIIISGEGTMSDVIEGLRLGAWDYLSKPIAPLDLLKHSIERALERAELLRQTRHHQQYLEATIALRTAELEKNNKERESLQSQLLHAQKLEAVGQLAAGIAHEINTPIQFVSSNVGFLDTGLGDIKNIITALVKAAEEERLTPAFLRNTLEEMDWPYLEAEIPAAIKQSQEGLSRVTSIVRAMKEFSHPGGKEFAQIDINHIIEITVTVARNEWKYGSEVVLHLAPNLPPVLCLANEISQTILNLLVNAAHAITEKLGRTPEISKGCITITTEYKDPWIFIHIADTGGGIPEAIRDRIFDPFFTTKEVGKGTGQGLAIAYDVVARKHNGKLSFASVVGEGTIFTIQLPHSETSQEVGNRVPPL